MLHLQNKLGFPFTGMNLINHGSKLITVLSLSREEKEISNSTSNENRKVVPTKSKNNPLTIIKDENLLPEGELGLIKGSKLRPKARNIDSKTKNRRVHPLVKSNFEDLDKNFRPTYSRFYKRLGKNITISFFLSGLVSLSITSN